MIEIIQFLKVTNMLSIPYRSSVAILGQAQRVDSQCASEEDTFEVGLEYEEKHVIS